MTPIALTFLILSILLVWGGLAVSIVALVRTSDEPDAPPSADPAATTPRTDDTH